MRRPGSAGPGRAASAGAAGRWPRAIIPDLHRLAPEGPGGQIRIGKAGDPEPGTVRHLIGELALLPMEGGARVVIVEAAHRLNDDAQNALLKMLEEPPAGVMIILCADDEECLLPTVRSRCARVRLGPVGGREIERWLGELGVADAPRAARLARLADGRPGLALAYARSVDAERIRGEIARGILDMLAEGRAARLASVRELMKSAAALDAALGAPPSDPVAAEEPVVPGPARGRRGKSPKPAVSAADPAAAEGAPADDAAVPRLAAADRRSAAARPPGGMGFGRARSRGCSGRRRAAASRDGAPGRVARRRTVRVGSGRSRPSWHAWATSPLSSTRT